MQGGFGEKQKIAFEILKNKLIKGGAASPSRLFLRSIKE